MDASIETQEGYILVTVTGEPSLVDGTRILMQFVNTYKDSPLRQILCDIRQVIGFNNEKGVMPRFEFAALIARLLPKRYQLALLMTHKQIDSQHFGENVMHNRGVKIKVTTDMNEALHWLGVGTIPGKNE